MEFVSLTLAIALGGILGAIGMVLIMVHPLTLKWYFKEVKKLAKELIKIQEELEDELD